MEGLNKEILNTLKRKQNKIEDISKGGKVLTSVRNVIIEQQKKSFIEFNAKKAGRVQYIDIEGLIRYAKDNNVIAETVIKVGEYVGKYSPVLLIWNYDKEEQIKCNVWKYLTIGNYKNTAHDIDFGLQKLEEIALRAISPSINDPSTAMLAVRNIGEILLEIYSYCNGKKYFYDNDQNLMLILNEMSFEDILYASFYKILNFSRNQISILASSL